VFSSYILASVNGKVTKAIAHSTLDVALIVLIFNLQINGLV